MTIISIVMTIISIVRTIISIVRTIISLIISMLVGRIINAFLFARSHMTIIGKVFQLNRLS